MERAIVCNRQQKRTMAPMQTIISSLLTWGCIATILAADAGHPLALRLEGAVAVIVGIFNAATALLLVALASSRMRAGLRKSWQAKKMLPCIYSVLQSLAWLAALAWAGWLWSFGIRLLWLMAWPAVVAYKAPEGTP